MTCGDEPIVLAHELPFALGRLTVRPATREVARDDGEVEVLEPRVMQVLVALHRAAGGIVARDDLTHSCWEGRVVGEDAINRVISRLRRTAGGIGEGAFRVETVTKVGYRLVMAEQARARGHAASPGAPASRRVLLGVAGAAMLAVGAGGWTWLRDGEDPPPPAVAGLVAQGLTALRQTTSDGNAQALALFGRVTEQAPNYAQGWGLLAFTYGLESHARSRVQVAAMRARAAAARDRALALDPGDAYAHATMALLLPRRTKWDDVERLLRAALRRAPDADPIMVVLASMLSSVGRVREAAALLDRAAAIAPPSPNIRYNYIVALWAAGRLVEADRAMAEAFSLFPRHFAVWFSRFYIMMYTGRADESLAMGGDRDGWPSGIDPAQIEWLVAIARALRSRVAADADAALAPAVDWAGRGTGLAENAIEFASALGRIDLAYRIAQAYYFGRGFSVPDLRFPSGQGTYTRLEDRRTALLFRPSTAAMRRDARFPALLADLGLERYWRLSGTEPDYRRR